MAELSLSALAERIEKLEKRDLRSRGRHAFALAAIDVLAVTVDAVVNRGGETAGHTVQLVATETRKLLHAWDIPDDVRDLALAAADELEGFSHRSVPESNLAPEADG